LNGSIRLDSLMSALLTLHNACLARDDAVWRRER